MVATYTDQQIRQNVLNTIQNDVRINPINISVGVNNGIVSLNGTIPTYFQMTAAGDDARKIKGVIGVQNNLVVTPQQTFPNQDLTQAVRANLDTDLRITTPSNIGVSVTNGVVTLTGTVPTYTQKSDAGTDAWTPAGVVNVLNEIAVVPPFTRSDADIAANVQGRLSSDTAINPANITVNVTNGTVYLNGIVPFYYQIQDAANDAWAVPGVVNVVNNLTVS